MYTSIREPSDTLIPLRPQIVRAVDIARIETGLHVRSLGVTQPPPDAESTSEYSDDYSSDYYTSESSTDYRDPEFVTPDIASV